MQITSSYLGSGGGNYRCYFYLVLQDYLDKERNLNSELSIELERLGRKLGNEGVVVQPFTGDVESVFREISAKPWTSGQFEQIVQTPCLLILGTQFVDFDPRHDEFIVLQLKHESRVQGSQVAALFSGIASLVNPDDEDPLGVVKQYLNSSCAAAICKSVELKPNFWGFALDLKKLLKEIKYRGSLKRAATQAKRSSENTGD